MIFCVPIKPHTDAEQLTLGEPVMFNGTDKHGLFSRQRWPSTLKIPTRLIMPFCSKWTMKKHAVVSATTFHAF